MLTVATAMNAQMQALYDPTSPQYRQFLTPDQFVQNYAPTAAQYQQLVNFAQSHGLTVAGTFSNNLLLDVTGPASTIENAFLVNMNYYQRPGVGGQF